MAKALEVAKYILYLSHRAGDCITNFKLQKLLYLLQADYLVAHDGKPLFTDNIMAFDCGPIIREVDSQYNRSALYPISEQYDYYMIELSPEEKKFIEDKLYEYIGISAYELERSIEKGQPWIEACENGMGNIVSVESMYTYYKALALEKEGLLKEVMEATDGERGKLIWQLYLTLRSIF